MFTTTAIYLVASRKLPEVGEYTMIGRLYMASLAASLCMTFVSILSSAINLVVSEMNNNRADLLAVFRHYDSDRSGSLSFDEADHALSALGLSESERDYILAKHDMDEADEIGIDEWLRLGEISRSLRPTTQYSVAISALVARVCAPIAPPSNAVHPTPAPEEEAAVLKSPEDAAEAGQAGGGGGGGGGRRGSAGRRGSGSRGSGVRRMSAGADDEVRPMPVMGRMGTMGRMGSMRSMGGRSFKLGAKRGELGVEVVAEWLVELGVDDKVLKRFEEEAIDVLAVAHLPLDKDKLERSKRSSAGTLEQHAIGFRGDPTSGLGGGGGFGAFHAIGVSEPAAMVVQPEPAVPAAEVNGSALGNDVPLNRSPSSKEDKMKKKVYKFSKHLGAWVDCVSLIVFPLIFIIYLCWEFGSGLDFAGAAVNVEDVKTVLELVDLRAPQGDEMCFANTQSIALPGSALCPDVKILY